MPCAWNSELSLLCIVPTLQLMPETLYLTTNLIDRFLELKGVSRKNLQLVRRRRRMFHVPGLLHGRFDISTDLFICSNLGNMQRQHPLALASLLWHGCACQQGAGCAATAAPRYV